MKRFRCENLLLTSASQLPFQDEWRRLANDLPTGSVLFIVTDEETPLKRSMRKIASSLQRKGRCVAAIRTVPRS